MFARYEKAPIRCSSGAYASYQTPLVAINRELWSSTIVDSIGVELESLVKGGLISKLIFVQVDPGQILNTLHWDRNKICQFLA